MNNLPYYHVAEKIYRNIIKNIDFDYINKNLASSPNMEFKQVILDAFKRVDLLEDYLNNKHIVYNIFVIGFIDNICPEDKNKLIPYMLLDLVFKSDIFNDFDFYKKFIITFNKQINWFFIKDEIIKSRRKFISLIDITSDYSLFMAAHKNQLISDKYIIVNYIKKYPKIVWYINYNNTQISNFEFLSKIGSMAPNSALLSNMINILQKNYCDEQIQNREDLILNLIKYKESKYNV